MENYYTHYNNFKEFFLKDPQSAEELLNNVGAGEWQNEPIYIYDGLEELAEYELYDGWYSGLDYLGKKYNGAPALTDFIDLKGLGYALERNWDYTCHHKLKSGKVVTTSYGW